MNKAKTRSGSLCGKGSTLPDVHIHNHFGETANDFRWAPSQHTTNPPSNTRVEPKHKREYIPDSNSESDLEPIQIDDVLQTLNNSMPTFNFPQYRERLLSSGICYGRSITDFDQSYYVDKVGMSDGAAAEFVRSANRMLGKQKREKEQVRKKMRMAGKENQPVHANSLEM